MAGKYSAIPTTVDNVTFASRLESRRYLQLKAMQRSGIIADLELQPRFPIVVNGHKICEYRGDFRFIDTRTGKTIVEDTKSSATITRIYVLKKKLVKALYGVDILEVLG